ncbi:hypothetical protein Fmac_031614 [Flemingia macrophylla]|uniref:Uncharacterized protein n=1 Tax=Flemingia macrophylla TaxID=520843 RepID=A0ABD1L315_9FABA
MAMATIGFDFAETYVTRKLYMEKMKKRAQEEGEDGEESTDIKISKIKTGSKDKTSSGCFSWVSKQHHKKISRVSDHSYTEAANS